MKKILFVILSFSIIMSSIWSNDANAIIANFDEVEARQKDTAAKMVIGTVERPTYISLIGSGIAYNLRVLEVKRGSSIVEGDVITLYRDCNEAADIVIFSSRQQCISDSPKSGEKMSLYLKSDNEQALIYGDDVLGVNITLISDPILSMLSIFGNISIAGFVIIVLVIALFFVLVKKYKKNKAIPAKKDNT